VDKFSFDDIDKARKLLGLPDEASLREIKEAYRNKAKKYHPDRYSQEKREVYERKMARVNRAYKVLLRFIEEYKISFKKEDVNKNNPDRDVIRFYKDWLSR